MTDLASPTDTAPTRHELLVAASASFGLATILIVFLVTRGDPANGLHVKTLDGAFNLIWLAAGTLLGNGVLAIVGLRK